MTSISPSTVDGTVHQKPLVSQLKLKLCVLHSSYAQSSSELKDLDPGFSVTRFLPHCDITDLYLHKLTAVAQIKESIKHNYQLYINLCDGAFDEDRAGPEVVQTLERFDLPFTGSSSAFYDPSRSAMKMLAYYAGLKTAPYVFAYREEEIEEASSLTFPVIAKHFNSFSSIGMTRDCKCYDMESVRREGTRIIKEYGGVLIEEFITGPEFTVLAAENASDPFKPVVYQPVQCVFPKGEEFKHFDLKWKDYEGIHWQPVKDAQLNERLKDMASKSLSYMMNGRAYARIDVRQRSSDGEVFFLEINPQPAVFYPDDAPGSSDQILMLDPHHSHVTFLENLIHSALHRHQSSQRAKHMAVVKSFPNMSGYGLFAGIDIKEGEVIQEGENQSYVLVSKKYLQSAAGRRNQKFDRWFSKYAYPVNDTLFVTWSDTPEEWRPINHSCDPNCWYSGLDMTARRDIKKGEQLSLDYATFCGENFEAFECQCGTVGCRGRIEWNEDLSMTEKYGEHVSDYIAERRSRMKMKMMMNGTTKGT